MRWLIKLMFVLLLLSGAASAQAFTQVTGQAKDSQGNLYVNCVFSIHFIGQSSQPGPYLFQGSTFQTTYAGVRCDGFGNFAIRLPSNQAIFPQPSGWEFNICDPSGHFCNGAGTGIITIAGSSQDITAIMSPLLPILPPVTGEVRSIFGRTGQVVAVTGDYNVSQVTGAAPLTSPVFSGQVQVPTAPVGTFSPQAASTAFVMTAIGNAISGGGGGGGGGWSPPPAPGDTLFGNNTIATSTPSFFIPGGDVSFSNGNFSVNQLHFGPNALALTNTGIATGNCLQVQGSTIVGGACGTGSGGGVISFNGRNGVVTPQAGDYGVALITGAAPLASPVFSGTPTVPTSTAASPGNLEIANTAFVYAHAGGPGGTTLQGCTTPTAGNLVCDNSIQGGTGSVGMLTLPYSGSGLPTPPTTAQAAIAANASGQLYWSPGNSTAFTQIGAGTGAVASVFGRTGPVVATAGDYTVDKVTGAAPLADPVFTGAPKAPKPVDGDSSTNIATTSWVKSNTPVQTITRSVQPAVCYAQQDVALNSYTFTGLTISSGDTVIVASANSGQGSQIRTYNISDNGGNTYTILASHATSTISPVVQGTLRANPASELTITMRDIAQTSNVAGKWMTCIATFRGVGSFGQPFNGTDSGTPMLQTGTITTQDNNGVVVFLAAMAGNFNGIVTQGTRLGSAQNSGSGGSGDIVLCQNTSPTPAAVSCSVTRGNTTGAIGATLAIELRPGVPGVTNAFTPQRDDSSTRIATTEWVRSQFPTTAIARGAMTPKCEVQQDTALASLTITSGLSIIPGETVMVGVSTPNYGNATVASVTDNAATASNVYRFLARYTSSVMGPSIFAAQTTRIASSLTVNMSAAGQFIACVATYTGVHSFGQTMGMVTSGINPAPTASVGTQFDNAYVFAMSGRSGNGTASAGPGSLLGQAAATGSGAPSGAMCENASANAGALTCTVTWATSASYNASIIAVEMRPGLIVPGGGTGGTVASVFNRTGAVAAQVGDYRVDQIDGAAPLNSPALVGAPTAPNPPSTDSSTRIATTSWVKANAGGGPGPGGGAAVELVLLASGQNYTLPDPAPSANWCVNVMAIAGTGHQIIASATVNFNGQASSIDLPLWQMVHICEVPAGARTLR